MSEGQGGPVITAAGRFRAMAEQIERQLPTSGFGGAFVIVPPENGGTPIAVMLLDDLADPAMFWSAVQTKAQIALREIEARERQGLSYGR